MLTVITFRWGNKYGQQHVDILRESVKRNLSIPHRFLCVGDDIPIEDENLLSVRDGCYVRLRCFDPEWQKRHDIQRLAWLDLDVVITGSLDPLFGRSEPLMVLRGGHFNPCPINGSVLMIKAGAHPEVWRDFTPERGERVSMRHGRWLGSDQTWIASKVPDASGWTYRDGIYGFGKPGWGGGDELPRNARIVIFPGKLDPSGMQHVEWVRRNWAE